MKGPAGHPGRGRNGKDLGMAAGAICATAASPLTSVFSALAARLTKLQSQSTREDQTMPDVFTGQEFAKSLSTGQLKKSIVRVGMAKKSDDSPDTILFAEGRMCREWISIPVSVIEQVTLLGNITCRDHGHPLVEIRFKEPDPKNETARVFAELARRVPRTQPVQTSPVARAKGAGGGGCIDQCNEEFKWCVENDNNVYECIEFFGDCLHDCGGGRVFGSPIIRGF